MTFSGYFSSSSFIKNLDSRGRIIFCFLFSVTIAVSSSFDSLISGGIIALFFLFLAKLKFRNFISRLFIINCFVVFLWLFLPFTTPGEIVWRYHGLEATSEGILLCSVITARTNIIMILLISLVSTIPIEKLGYSLQQLMLPRKLVYLLIFTIRYIHVIDRERERLFNAAKARGFVPRPNIHSYRTIAYFVGMLLVKSMDRAENVHQAMLCRGFSGKFHAIEHLCFRKRDIFLISSGFIISAFILVFEFLPKN